MSKSPVVIIIVLLGAAIVYETGWWSGWLIGTDQMDRRVFTFERLLADLEKSASRKRSASD